MKILKILRILGILKKTRPTLWDIVLLVVLLTSTLSGMLFIGRLVPAGSEVTIEVNNKLLYKFPIDKDRSVKISHMEIEIKDGKVRVADADCPNKLCVRQGWIDRGAIICLPNRVVISVVNPYEKRDGDDEVDAISG